MVDLGGQAAQHGGCSEGSPRLACFERVSAPTTTSSHGPLSKVRKATVSRQAVSLEGASPRPADVSGWRSRQSTKKEKQASSLAKSIQHAEVAIKAAPAAAASAGGSSAVGGAGKKRKTLRAKAEKVRPVSCSV